MDKIITVDGPSGAGKGTASRNIARALGWRWLDSGALYRLVSLQAINNHIAVDDIDSLVDIAVNLDVHFGVDSDRPEPTVRLGQQDVTYAIRTEECSIVASKISAHPPVRTALLQRQRSFFTTNGLVADGRDMGTVIFPQAPLKFYLTASVKIRAKRRHDQLQQAGIDVNIAAVLREIESRDARDINRAVSPMNPAKDAIVVDTSDLTIEGVYAEMMQHVETRGLGGLAI